jgi:hypothetical protein
VVVDNGLRQTTGNEAGLENHPVADTALLETPRRAKAGGPCADDQMSDVHVRDVLNDGGG